jgi:hypothetical protein
MLSELALGTEVFRTDEYGDAAFADVCLAQFRAAVFEDFVVRDLRMGGWHAYVLAQEGRLHPKGKELLKKLKSQKRLISHISFRPTDPVTDEEWENEALGTHTQIPLAGMVFGQQAKTLRHEANPLVACPQKLTSAPFWSSRTCSRRIPRKIGEYRKLLDLVLCHANWLAFIDPHLNPSDRKYRDFHQLLASCARRNPAPLLEIHRVAWMGDGHDRRERSTDHERIFRQHLEPQLRQGGVQVRIFLWDDFHDRFLASNLIGLSWSNGFDTSADAASSVTVARLSRSDRDDLQQEFSVNSPKHHLKHQFVIG